MNPVAVSLFILGYGFALPVLTRWKYIPARYRNAAFMGHQFGMFLAAGGWLVRGRPYAALVHVAWIIAARLLLRRAMAR